MEELVLGDEFRHRCYSLMMSQLISIRICRVTQVHSLNLLQLLHPDSFQNRTTGCQIFYLSFGVSDLFWKRVWLTYFPGFFLSERNSALLLKVSFFFFENCRLKRTGFRFFTCCTRSRGYADNPWGRGEWNTCGWWVYNFVVFYTGKCVYHKEPSARTLY